MNEFWCISYTFHKDDDDPCVRVFGKKIDEIGNIQNRFISRGNEITESKMLFLCTVRNASQPSTLGDKSDMAFYDGIQF